MVRDLLTIQPYLSRPGWKETEDGLQQRRFARAVRADDGDHLTALHLDRDIVKDLRFAISRDEPRGLKRERHRYCPPR